MAKIAKILIDAIIPDIPIISFDWNKNAEPRKTAEDRILPESSMFGFLLYLD